MRTKTQRRRRAPLAIAAAVLALAAVFGAAESTRAGSEASLSSCRGTTGAPVTIGANWTLTTAAGAPAAVAPTAEQVEVVKFEINADCGLRIGTARKPVGSPLAMPVGDNRTTAARSGPVTTELIALGAVAVVGGGGSVTGPPAAQAAVEANVPFGANQAAADSMSGCTAAELADPAVTKSATPVYGAGQCWNHRGLVFRTTASGYQFGTEAAAYARATYPARTTAAILYRDDDFGRPNRDGTRARFVELGGTVLAEGGFNGVTTTVAQFKTLLQTTTAGNPALILGSHNLAVMGNFMQAYVELRDDPTWTAKPANFDTLRFVWGSTLSGDYSALGAAALAALASQTVFVQPAWDPDSVAYQRWFALYRAYDPAALPPASGFFLSAYDALTVMALAISAAGTTDGPAVAANLRRVANPPGKVVCPGQWKKAFRLLAQGKDINYEGALGPVDLDERGNATGITYGIFEVQAGDGSTILARLLGNPAQPACAGHGVGFPGGDEDDDNASSERTDR